MWAGGRESYDLEHPQLGEITAGGEEDEEEVYCHLEREGDNGCEACQLLDLSNLEEFSSLSGIFPILRDFEACY